MRHFFLLILGILFNSASNTIYKDGGFFKPLSKKAFKFVLDKKINPVLFFLCFVLLSSKVDPILRESGCKKYKFKIYSFNRFKIILILVTKIKIVYMQVIIIMVQVFTFD